MPKLNLLNMARELAQNCSEWVPDQAATIATTLTNQAYTALQAALIGINDENPRHQTHLSGRAPERRYA